MDIRIISLINCLGIYMTARQNQDLTDIGNELNKFKRERDEYAKDVLTLCNQLRYCVRIAERGTGGKCPEEQSGESFLLEGESFLLEYVKGIEKERDELAVRVEVMCGHSSS